MRRLFNKKVEEDDADEIHHQRAVEPDGDIPGNVGQYSKTMVPDAESSLRPGWEKEKKGSGSRRSLNRRSLRLSLHDSEVYSQSDDKDVSPSRSIVSKASLASFDDVFEHAEEEDDQYNAYLNPDAEVQIDADEADFENYNLPRDSPKNGKKKKEKKKKGGARISQRLSARFTKLMGSGKASNTTRKPTHPSVVSKDRTQSKTVEQNIPNPRPKKSSSLRNSMKRISIRKPPSVEKMQAKSAKQKAKQDKKEEARRLKELRSNPWFPAGVDFRYLSPKSVWLPFMGSKDSSNDFGDEARLITPVK